MSIDINENCVDMTYYNDYEKLKELMASSGYKFDMERIDKAYQFALAAHKDQRRVSGLPYILHPTSVACILVGLGMDTDSIIAALLHDVVEDTEYTLEDVTKLFGSDIALLIDGLTKLAKIKYSNREEQQAENLRKMLIAMSNDIRVIIIKLADRLHNMRTIGCMKEQKRRDKALENMEVYAPIAHRLGITAVKEEMEDLSLRYLDPVGYKEIEDELNNTAHDRDEFIASLKEEILERSRETIDNVYISGRVKSIHSIYRKTFMKGKGIDEIYDIFAVRVIVDSVIDCYNVLGIIHDIYKPIPNRFKDYISTPKPNMYQSLHTTVINHRGIPFEVQIRTWDMHHTAEYGIAAHWKYKAGVGGKNGDSLDEHLSWVRKMLDIQKEADDATDIVSTIKTDLNPNEVFVFTPKGDVINLPSGATVIDLAYTIHSAVGNSMIGAKVDRRIVPIDYQLKTGEIVEILTQKEGQGPKRDWLKIVKTSEARSKIRSWFKKERREENIAEGQLEFDKELRKNGIQIPEKDLQDFLSKVNLKIQISSLDDFYAAVGYGGIQLWKIMPRIRELYQKLYGKQQTEVPVVQENPQTRKKVGSGVIVEGMDDVLIKFSRCCNPVPGDDIIGFITRGYGVSIHKCGCTNVPADVSRAEEPDRWVSAHWEHTVKEVFQTSLEIIGQDRTGFLADVSNQLSALHIMIRSLNCKELPKGMAIINVTIDVTDTAHLRSVMTRLSTIRGITSVTRR